MKKIEFIWREILYQTIEKRQTRFQQQALASLFRISSSTVNAALAPLRELGAIDVGGRGFAVIDYEKILYHWANHRSLRHDTALRLSISLSIQEIEGFLPPKTIPTAYTACRERFGSVPSDYDAVWCYHNKPQHVRDRFTAHITDRGRLNLSVLTADPYLWRYESLPLAQLFVDLWQMHDWYAKEFIKSVKEHIDGLLS